MTLINLTPHPICLYDGEECIKRIPSSGVALLSSSTQKRIDSLCAIHCVEIFTEPEYEKIVGLPEEWKQQRIESPEDRRCIIVSKISAEWLKQQLYQCREILDEYGIRSVFYPDTGPESAVRKDGQIVGVRRLCWSCGGYSDEHYVDEPDEKTLNFLMAACQYG